MAGWAGGLLRRHGEPRQATYLELFFDLVYVFAFTRVSQRLTQNITFSDGASGRWTALAEGGKTLLLLLALFHVWLLTVWMTSRFDPRRSIVQLVVMAAMFGSMLMAVALPRAFSERGLVFAGAYVTIQISRPLFLGIALRGHPLRRTANRVLFWSLISAVPWIAGALVHGTGRTALWTLAVVVDYIAIPIGVPTPWLGRSHISEWIIVPEHVAERYRQLLLIALGESILVIGITFSETGFETDRTVAFPVAFATTVLLWRIYFYRAGDVLGAAISASREPPRLNRLASSTHLLMVTGMVATAVGYEITIIHPLGPTEPLWLAAIIGGPALFLVGRARFEYVVFGRMSRSRLIGLLVLVAIAPAAAFVPPVVAGIAAALVLAGVAASDLIRGRGRPPEAPSPPM